MPQTVIKVAVSLPMGLYSAVEGAREETALTRSALVQDALRLWLRDRDLRRQREAYVEGYRKDPEDSGEAAAAEATAARLLATPECR